jgi:hypothetical protein
MRRSLGVIVLVLIASCQCKDSSSTPLELASTRGVTFDIRAASPPADYDPLALATASIGRSSNPTATIPPMCYTRTEGSWNPCWTCHTRSSYPNLADDWELQQNFPFLNGANVNNWKNLFRNRGPMVEPFNDAEVHGYVRVDNYAPLRAALAARPDFRGWQPDLDFARGFASDGFANDGSGWRAIRYKPFPGTFWPTNGSSDDVYIRLPDAFQRDAEGKPSSAVYRTNLAILEAAIASDPRRADAEIVRVIEPIEEQASGLDLDRDGVLAVATRIVGLPETFVGQARSIRVLRALYPAGVEFLHTVRYLDPDQPGFMARRMKEVRYARKLRVIVRKELSAAYNRIENTDAPFEGEPRTGYRTPQGWQLQAWIEDARGWLRLQTHEEHQFCMGCHSNIGVTVDQTFALARKLPGREGWRPQDARGIPDVPQIDHVDPEYAEYLARVGGGDELRANDEIRAKFFASGSLDRERVAAFRGDIGELVFPARARAIALDRAYLANVIEQSYIWGRDAVASPVPTVHAAVRERSTGLGENDRVYRDGRLHLDW